MHVCPCVPLIIQTPVPLEWGPPHGPHVNLGISTNTLFTTMVTFPETRDSDFSVSFWEGGTSTRYTPASLFPILSPLPTALIPPTSPPLLSTPLPSPGAGSPGRAYVRPAQGNTCLHHWIMGPTSCPLSAGGPFTCRHHTDPWGWTLAPSWGLPAGEQFPNGLTGMFSPWEQESPLFPGKHPEALAEQSTAGATLSPDLFPGPQACGGTSCAEEALEALPDCPRAKGFSWEDLDRPQDRWGQACFHSLFQGRLVSGVSAGSRVSCSWPGLSPARASCWSSGLQSSHPEPGRMGCAAHLLQGLPPHESPYPQSQWPAWHLLLLPPWPHRLLRTCPSPMPSCPCSPT